MARYHRLVVAVWVVVVVGSAILVPRFQSSVTGPPLDVLASDSYRAQEILSTHFDQPFAEQDLIVFESESLVATDLAFQAVIGTALDRVEELPGVVGVIGPFDPRAEGLVAEEGRVATAVVGLSGSNADRQALAPRLTQAASSAATDEVRVYVTGRSPLIAELVTQQEADLSRAERLGLPIALLILLISSGAVVAAGLPLVLAMSGVIVTFGALGAASTFTEFNLFVPNIASMIGLGVGIDYALFIVNRFREELVRGMDPRSAVTTTTATAGRTVFFSALTVLLSLAGLLLVDARIFQELALGAMASRSASSRGPSLLTKTTCSGDMRPSLNSRSRISRPSPADCSRISLVPVSSDRLSRVTGAARASRITIATVAHSRGWRMIIRAQ